MFMRLTDAHMHPCDPSDGRPYADMQDLEMAVGCTARPSDWDGMASCVMPGLYRSYGVHPWYAGEWDARVRERLVSILEDDPHAHVGEVGLDAKRGEPMTQIDAFREQLSIAHDIDRVASIHMVGSCEKLVLDALKGSGCPRSIIHSFMGPDSYIGRFRDCGCYLSVSPRLMSSPRRVASVLSGIPLDRILLETDHPYTGRGFGSMEGHVRQVAGALGMEPDELADTVAENLRRLMRDG